MDISKVIKKIAAPLVVTSALAGAGCARVIDMCVPESHRYSPANLVMQAKSCGAPTLKPEPLRRPVEASEPVFESAGHGRVVRSELPHVDTREREGDIEARFEGMLEAFVRQADKGCFHTSLPLDAKIGQLRVYLESALKMERERRASLERIQQVEGALALVRELEVDYRASLGRGGR